MSQSRSFKVFILSSGNFLSSIASLLSLAILARVFSVTDYATYRQTILAYTFAAPLLMLGLPQALYYFLPREKERSRGLLLENLLMLSVLGAVFSLFLLFGGNRLLAWRFNNPSLQDSLLILAPYPLAMLPAATMTACLMARDRVRQVAWFNIFSRVGMVLVVIFAALLWRTPEAAVWGTVVGAALALIPAVVLMLKATRNTGQQLSPKSMKSQVGYSVPLGLGGIVDRTAFGLDKIIVASMCTPEIFAVYVNGAMELPLFRIVTGSMTSVLVPEMTGLCQAGERKKALELMGRGACKCALVLYPVMFALFGLAPELMTVLFSSTYLESALPFRLFLFLLPLRVMNFGSMFMAIGKSYILMLRALGDLLINLGLTIVFVRLWGYLGAAVATLVTMYLWQMPFNSYFIRKEYNVSYLRMYPLATLGKIFGICGLCAMVFLFKHHFSTHNVFADLVVYGVLYSGLTLFLLIKTRLFSWRWLMRAVSGS